MSDEPDRLTGQLMHLPKIIGNLGLNIAAAQRELDANYLDGLGRLMQMIRATVGRSEKESAGIAVAFAQRELERATAALEELDADAPAEQRDAAEQAKADAQEGLGKANELLEDASEAEENAGQPIPAGGTFQAGLEALLRSLAPSRYQFTETTLDFSADLAETMDRNYQVGLGVGVQAVVLNAAFSQGFSYDYRAAARITTVLHAISPDRSLTDALLGRAREIRSAALTLPDRSETEQRVWDRVGEIFGATTGQLTGEEEPEPAG
jgi:hypothetical protein